MTEKGFWECVEETLKGVDQRILDGDIKPVQKEELAEPAKGPVANMSYEDELMVSAFGYAKLALHGMSSRMRVGEFTFDLYDRESVEIAISFLECEVVNSTTRHDAHRPEIPLYSRVAEAYRAAIGMPRQVTIPEPQPLNTTSSD